MISLYSCPGVCKIFSSLSASHPQREVGHISLSSLCREEWRSESTVTVHGPALRQDKNKNLTPNLWASCCSHCPKTYWTNREMQILLSFKQQRTSPVSSVSSDSGISLAKGEMGSQSSGDGQNYTKQLPDSEKQVWSLFQTLLELCTILSFSNNSPWRKRNILIKRSLSYLCQIGHIFSQHLCKIGTKHSRSCPNSHCHNWVVPQLCRQNEKGRNLGSGSHIPAGAGPTPEHLDFKVSSLFFHKWNSDWVSVPWWPWTVIVPGRNCGLLMIITPSLCFILLFQVTQWGTQSQHN